MTGIARYPRTMTVSEDRCDDPQSIATYLLQQHGQKDAYEVALKGVMEAQAEGDNYRLSIWREVKALLVATAGAEG